MDDDFDFASAVISSIQRAALAEDLRGAEKKNAANLQPIVATLRRFGLQFDDDPIEDADELATLVDLAARNFSVGRRRAGGIRRTAGDADLQARIRAAAYD